MSKRTNMIGGAMYGNGPYKSRNGNIKTVEYQTWYNMLQRCYNKSYHERRPKSCDCEVHQDWLDFQNFAGWLTNHESYNKGYVLDKDLLIAGNRVYSPDTCLLIPNEINVLISNSAVAGKELPMGVRKHKDKYKVIISLFGKQKHIGVFECVEDALACYVKTKEDYAKATAKVWRTRIEKRAYDALMSWQVDIS